MVPMVTAPSPWLHTNRHGHSVAQPTASAVGHVKVRAIISPPQAWGRVTWQEETPPPLLRWSQAPPPLLRWSQAPGPALTFHRALLRARRDGVGGSQTRGTNERRH
uniref:Uncharacterized protein n=1 Tax=Peromyscus maniculatus bairdii TaxID=230844 RepID=A0A8C8UPG1_PERMB